MKIFFNIIFFSTLFVSSIRAQHEADSMVIRFAPWDTLTDVAIECLNFETSIDYQVCNVKDPSAIIKVRDELNCLEESLNGNEDIRCKILFYNAGEVMSSCCIGKYRTRIDANYYNTSSSLIAVIDSIINCHSTKLKKDDIVRWNSTQNIQKVCKYIESQTERLYNSDGVNEDLAFIIFCNVGGDGRTLKLKFTKNKIGKKGDIPLHIVSVLEKILYDEIRWDVPPRHYAEWITIPLRIRFNVQK